MNKPTMSSSSFSINILTSPCKCPYKYHVSLRTHNNHTKLMFNALEMVPYLTS